MYRIAVCLIAGAIGHNDSTNFVGRIRVSTVSLGISQRDILAKCLSASLNLNMGMADGGAAAVSRVEVQCEFILASDNLSAI